MREDIDLAEFNIPEVSAITEDHLKRLFRLAYFDDLTGLANRVLLRERMGQAVVRAKQGGTGSLLFIDLDNFKTINDKFGHLLGDQLLRTVAGRLISCIRPQDTAARIGGDEFGVLLEDVDYERFSEKEVAEVVAKRIIHRISQPLQIENEEIAISASIGMTSFHQQTDIAQILHRADSAMYTAKTREDKFAWG